MNLLKELSQAFFPPGPRETLSQIPPERLSWNSVDSWIYRYVKENGQIEGLRILAVSLRLPDDSPEILYRHLSRLRENGHFVPVADPRNPHRVFESSRVWREAGRIHSPNITWQLFWPEERPV